MTRPKILFVLTSHKRTDDQHPGGWYLPELAHPYHVLANKADITVASPRGGESPVDPSSVEATKDDKISQDFLEEGKKVYQHTEKLSDFVGKTKDFDAIFYVGGHGPMFDLADDATSQQIIREFWEADKVVSAVCHGPAVFYDVKLSDGTLLVKGKEVTAFTNEEEKQVGLEKAVPFLPEDALDKASGGKFVKAEKPWGEKVVVSGRLITGQNPASATGVGEALAKALGV